MALWTPSWPPVWILGVLSSFFGTVMLFEPYLVNAITFTDHDKPFAIAYVNQYTGEIQQINEGITFIFVSGPPPICALQNEFMNAFEVGDQRKVKWTKTVTSGANSIAQRATIAALQANPSQIKYMVDEFHNRRDIVIDLLREIDGFKLNVPGGAFYVFPDVSYYFGKTIKGTEIKNKSGRMVSIRSLRIEISILSI